MQLLHPQASLLKLDSYQLCLLDCAKREHYSPLASRYFPTHLESLPPGAPYVPLSPCPHSINLFFFFFGRVGLGHNHSAHGLFLILCSGLSLGHAWGMIGVFKTRVSHSLCPGPKKSYLIIGLPRLLREVFVIFKNCVICSLVCPSSSSKVLSVPTVGHG